MVGEEGECGGEVGGEGRRRGEVEREEGGVDWLGLAGVVWVQGCRDGSGGGSVGEGGEVDAVAVFFCLLVIFELEDVDLEGSGVHGEFAEDCGAGFVEFGVGGGEAGEDAEFVVLGAVLEEGF